MTTENVRKVTNVVTTGPTSHGVVTLVHSVATMVHGPGVADLWTHAAGAYITEE